MKNLTNAADIVDVLGGPGKVARLTRTNVKAVWNWHGYFGVFPADTYAVMIEALEKLGYSASPALWRQRGFKRKRAA